MCCCIPLSWLPYISRRYSQGLMCSLAQYCWRCRFVAFCLSGCAVHSWALCLVGMYWNKRYVRLRMISMINLLTIFHGRHAARLLTEHQHMFWLAMLSSSGTAQSTVCVKLFIASTWWVVWLGSYHYAALPCSMHPHQSQGDVNGAFMLLSDAQNSDATLLQ